MNLDTRSRRLIYAHIADVLCWSALAFAIGACFF